MSLEGYEARTEPRPGALDSEGGEVTSTMVITPGAGTGEKHRLCGFLPERCVVTIVTGAIRINPAWATTTTTAAVAAVAACKVGCVFVVTAHSVPSRAICRSNVRIVTGCGVDAIPSALPAVLATLLPSVRGYVTLP